MKRIIVSRMINSTISHLLCSVFQQKEHFFVDNGEVQSAKMLLVPQKVKTIYFSNIAIVRSEAMKIKSNNLTKSNREESNIVIIILKKEQFDRTIIISHFRPLIIFSPTV